MNIYCPNPYLDELLSMERRKKEFCDSNHLKGKENQMKNAPLFVDPVIGTYPKFSWELGFPLSEEIIVMLEGYYPEKSCVYHSHDFFEIIYIYSGHCRTQVSNQTVDLQSGDICLYNQHAIHSVEFTKPEDGAFNIVIRKDSFRRLLLELLTESDLVSSFFLHILYDQKNSDTCIYLRPDDHYQCVRLAQQIIETFFLNKPMRKLVVKSQLLLLLMEIARQYREQQVAQSNQPIGKLNIDAVIQYISTHYLDASQEDVARHFGYSSKTLTRLLKKYTGVGFREIVQDVRFSRARMLLQESDLPVDKIALALGYQDRSNFENAFKKYCHITPSAYRKQFCAKK